MTAPAFGFRRVFVRSSVGGYGRAEWADVPEGRELESWLGAALVTDADFAGAPAPETIPAYGCCGHR